MGKNAAHKEQQRSRHGGADEAAAPDVGDGTVDASFHSPAWHAARIAAMTVPRVSWEDFKKQQKAAEQLEATTEADEAEKMRKYRAQLDADRAAKLAKGTNHAHFREPVAEAGTSASKKRKHSDKEKSSSKRSKDKDKDKKHKKHKSDGKDKGAKRSKDKKSKSESSKSKHRKEKKQRLGESTGSSGSSSGSESS